MEEYRDIKGYEGLYQVSNKGNIKSLNYLGKGKIQILKKRKTAKGRYFSVMLCKNGTKKEYLIHRLVAEAFIPNKENLPQVNHKDENGFNNCVDNLEWCDRKYNCNYGTRNERHNKAVKKQVLQYTKNGEFLREWDSASDAEETFGKRYRSNISKCCRRIVNTAYGFVWRFKN